MAFEEFKARGKNLSKEPRITIGKTGQFHLNRVCEEQWPALRDATHAVLMFDRETNRIGIKPLKQAVPHAYRLRRTQQARQCAGSAFLAGLRNRYRADARLSGNLGRIGVSPSQ